MASSCVENRSYNLPSFFTDTSTLTIQYDNLGAARISFAVLHKADFLNGGPVSFSINGVTFKGFVDTITQTDLPGTVYKESRVTVLAYSC